MPEGESVGSSVLCLPSKRALVEHAIACRKVGSQGSLALLQGWPWGVPTVVDGQAIPA